MAAGALKDVVSQQLEKDQKKGEGEKIEPKEFFWDQFLKYISSGILLLTLINVSVEFLQGGGIICFTPSEQEVGMQPNITVQDFSRDQASYVNSYCARSVPSTEYFPLYVLIHGLMLIAPHYIWSALFHGDFDSFFDIAKSLDRLRDNKTGEYDAKNFDRVKKLDIEYGGKNRGIFRSYVLKLFIQLGVCIGSVVFSAGFFIDYSFSFQCPDNFSPDSIPENWPLQTTVACVYTSLRLLSLVRFADYILLLLALGLVVFGLAWCFMRHKVQLGYKQTAKFSFQSCLTSDSFVFPPAVEVSFRKLRNGFRAMWCCCRHSCSCKKAIKLHLSNLFNPRIRSDLDFLLMRLFRADSSHGRVFKDIQVNKELKSLTGRDHQLLHLYLNVQQDIRSRANAASGTETVAGDDAQIKDLKDFFVESGFTANPEADAYEYFRPYLGNTEWQRVSGIRDRLYGFVQFAPKDDDGHPKNGLAIDISFGSIGYSLALARPFKRVVSVNFHPFYRDKEASGHREQFYTNYVTVTFPEDIFTWSGDCITKAGTKVFDYIKETGRTVDFIVVGPLNEEAKKSTVNLLIEMLYTAQYITEGALLLAIRPLKVAHKKLIGRKAFCEYKPPQKYFDHKYHKDKVENVLSRALEGFSYVDEETEGVAVHCDDVRCIFEFITYRFIGKYLEPAAVCEPDEDHASSISSRSTESKQQGSEGSNAAAVVFDALESFAATLQETCSRQRKSIPPISATDASQKRLKPQRTIASRPAASSANISAEERLARIKLLPTRERYISTGSSGPPTASTCVSESENPRSEPFSQAASFEFSAENTKSAATSTAQTLKVISPIRPDNEAPTLESFEEHISATAITLDRLPNGHGHSISSQSNDAFQLSQSKTSHKTRPTHVLVQSKPQASSGVSGGIANVPSGSQQQSGQKSSSTNIFARTDSIPYSPGSSQMNIPVDDFLPPLSGNAPVHTIRSNAEQPRGFDKNRMNGNHHASGNGFLSHSQTDV